MKRHIASSVYCQMSPSCGTAEYFLLFPLKNTFLSINTSTEFLHALMHFIPFYLKCMLLETALHRIWLNFKIKVTREFTFLHSKQEIYLVLVTTFQPRMINETLNLSVTLASQPQGKQQTNSHHKPLCEALLLNQDALC